MSFAFFNPFLTLFASHLILLPCHPVIPTMLLFNLYLLGLFWACYMLFICSIPVAQHYHWVNIHAVFGFLGPFHRFRASFAHFILLGILSPFHLLGHLQLISILHSHGFLLSLLGFPGPNYHILYFGVYGLFHQPLIYLILYFGILWPIFACFLFLIMPMSLPLLSLGSFGPACFL